MGWVCDSLCRIQPCSYSAAIRCADKAIIQKCLLDNLQYLWLHLTWFQDNEAGVADDLA
ncbi:hypothetical protein SAMN05216194_105314 [Stutzerimonas kunmingensis]|nr:hypothetical protein SAMN05216194_105314 [Stutzerimonas kunmingensis]